MYILHFVKFSLQLVILWAHCILNECSLIHRIRLTFPISFGLPPKQIPLHCTGPFAKESWNANNIFKLCAGFTLWKGHFLMEGEAALWSQFHIQLCPFFTDQCRRELYLCMLCIQEIFKNNYISILRAYVMFIIVKQNIYHSNYIDY